MDEVEDEVTCPGCKNKIDPSVCHCGLTCPGCKNKIDPSVCHCGLTYEAHRWEEHPFVAYGCDCLRSDR